MKRRIAGVTTGLMLLFAASASANHVNAVTSTASCTGVTVQFEQFSVYNGTINWTNKVDGVQSNAGSITPFNGNKTLTFDYPTPLVGPGSHTVVFAASWLFKGDNNGTFTKVVEGCPVPPPPPVVEEQPPPVPVPAEQPAVAAPPVALPPVVVPPAPKVYKKVKPKVCAFGIKRFDSKGHRLKDSHGHKIALCKSAPKPPAVRRPAFTG